MLKKENRLRKTKEIEGVLKNGRSFYNSDFTLKVEKNNLEKNRLCVVISAKVSKKAVDRNKLKRRVRAIFYSQKDELKNGFDFLFISKKGSDIKEFSEIKESVLNLFKIAKVLK